jgi:hypothetical protein
MSSQIHVRSDKYNVCCSYYPLVSFAHRYAHSSSLCYWRLHVAYEWYTVLIFVVFTQTHHRRYTLLRLSGVRVCVCIDVYHMWYQSPNHRSRISTATPQPPPRFTGHHQVLTLTQYYLCIIIYLMLLCPAWYDLSTQYFLLNQLSIAFMAHRNSQLL